MINTLIDHLLTHKRLHFTWLALVTVFFLVSITGIRIRDKQILPGLRVDNSMEVWLNSDDPDWINYQNFHAQFEDDDFIVLAFKADNIFTRDALKKISDLTEKLEKIPYILNVTSLTNTEYIHGKNDTISFSELIPEVPDNIEEIDRIKHIALSNPIFRSNLISDDGQVTAIIIRVEKQPEGVNYQRKLTDQLYKFIEKESENGKYTLHIAGISVLIGLEDRASTDDASLEYSLVTILTILFLYVIHRRLVYVLISLAVVIMANIWIHGVLPLFGSTYNMITSILATLIMVIGIADTIHFISEYKTQRDKTGSTVIAAKRAFLMISLPCFFTSLTTAAGFMSMVVSNMKAVKEFGIYAALGMLITFIINMVLVSLWLSNIKKAPDSDGRRKTTQLFERFLAWVANVNQKHVKINIVIAVLVLLISLTGLVKIDVNTNEITYFRKNNPIRQATEFIEANMTGTVALEIMLTGREDAFKKIENLKKIEELQTFVTSIDQIRKSFSVVDYIKEMNKAFQNNDNAYFVIPDDEDLIADLFFLGEGSEEIDSYVDTMTYSAARIHSRLNYVDNKTLKTIIDDINHKISETFTSGNIKAEIIGQIPLYVSMVDYLIDSQIKGFGLALVTIFIMLSLLVRSLKLGLIAMVPNIIPIFLTFGIMGWVGIPLDVGTVLIASVAIGLAVDDTIHFISRFSFLFYKRQNYEYAITKTIKTIGVPLTITSVVLFFGFGVMIVSTFKPIVYFGILAAITMISALIGDLFVLPALIKVFKPFGPEKIEGAEAGER